jgi:hypothetical protein
MTLFQSSGRQELLVSIDSTQSDKDLKEKLWNWIEVKHSEIFWDIEMFEGGRIALFRSTQDDNDLMSIEFWGDNGVFTLEAVETETI